VLEAAGIGGANWPPSSYDPETALLYVCADDRIGVHRRGGRRRDGLPTEPGSVTRAASAASQASAALGHLRRARHATNRLVWRSTGRQCYSGSVATRGGLVFVGRNDGRLTALDKRTARLWEFRPAPA
jgi:quinohemoprotein ethanol dehydrogenase